MLDQSHLSVCWINHIFQCAGSIISFSVLDQSYLILHYYCKPFGQLFMYNQFQLYMCALWTNYIFRGTTKTISMRVTSVLITKNVYHLDKYLDNYLSTKVEFQLYVLYWLIIYLKRETTQRKLYRTFLALLTIRLKGQTD